MALKEILGEIENRIDGASFRYGPFASTHEALGVASEEWDEFRQAIHSNDLRAVADECLDLAAVLIRLARDLMESKPTQRRSVK